MKSNWFRLCVWTGIAASALGLALAAPADRAVQAQAIPTDTQSAPAGSAYITQTYSEPVNVRTGPSTVYYPVIGQLPIGATAQALAASPSREWIEIAYATGPGGVGWIYAANVTLTGTLQVVEPPPTAVPLETATVDPTLAAAFSFQPTQSRLPTFTPPPPLVVPTFVDTTAPAARFALGPAIGVVVLLGIVVLGLSLFIRS
jgi:hypothetical protein